MSLTSLADAPLLSKPSSPEASNPNTARRPRQLSKDQHFAIDALFDDNPQRERPRRNTLPLLPNAGKNSSSNEAPSNAGSGKHTVAPCMDLQPPTPTLIHPLKHQASSPVLQPVNPNILQLSNSTLHLSKVNVPQASPTLQRSPDLNLQPSPGRRINDTLNLTLETQHRDPNDVLAGFLADASSDIDAGQSTKEEKGSHQEEVKSKWNSHSSQQSNELLVSKYSPRQPSNLMLPTMDGTKKFSTLTKVDHDNKETLKKEKGGVEVEDVLSLLPDDSNHTSNVNNHGLSGFTMVSENTHEEKSEFGGYTPSCLSLSKTCSAPGKRQLANFFLSSEDIEVKAAHLGLDSHKPQKLENTNLMTTSTDLRIAERQIVDVAAVSKHWKCTENDALSKLHQTQLLNDKPKQQPDSCTALKDSQRQGSELQEHMVPKEISISQTSSAGPKNRFPLHGDPTRLEINSCGDEDFPKLSKKTEISVDLTTAADTKHVKDENPTTAADIKHLKDENSTSAAEIQHLKAENVALKEEIMKLETEKLRLEKDFFERELLCEAQAAKHFNKEKQEAQRLTEELTSELMCLKQSSILTEEKIESIKKVHKKELDALSMLHMRQLEDRDKQIIAERSFLVETKNAVEVFSELLRKADDWSIKLEELHKSMVSESFQDKPKWLLDVESLVVDHEKIFIELKKRTMEICNQMEKVAITLENAVHGLEKLPFDEELLSKTQAQLQSLQEILKDECRESLQNSAEAKDKPDQCCKEKQVLISKLIKEKKQLEVGQAAALHMKEQLHNVDAALHNQLLEHTLRMQTEAEEMARQYYELQRAKDIAAEIAHEVQNGWTELEMHKTVYNTNSKTSISHAAATNIKGTVSCELHNMGKVNCANKRSFSTLGKQENALLQRAPWAPRCVNLASDSSEGGPVFAHGSASTDPQGLLTEEEKAMEYIKAQEDFLIQAAQALEDMKMASIETHQVPGLLGS